MIGCFSDFNSGTRLRATIGSSLVAFPLVSNLASGSLLGGVSDVRLDGVDRVREILVGNGVLPSLDRSTRFAGLVFLPSGNSIDSVIPVDPTGVLLDVDFSSKLGGTLVSGAEGFGEFCGVVDFGAATAARDELMLGPAGKPLLGLDIGAGTLVD